MRLKNRRGTPWLFALALGALGTLQYHLRQFTSNFDTYFGDRGDARGIVALCEHWYLTLRGQAELLSPGMFYPVKGNLGYSEFLLGFGVPYSFMRTLGFGMFTSLEVVVVALNFLNYVACFVLLYKVLRFHYLAACAGAMFFAFNSPKFFQLGHIQLQFVLFLPFVFGFVIIFARRAAALSQRKAFALLSLAGLALNLQLLTAYYPAWYFTFWSFLFLALALVFPASRRYILDLIRRFWPAFLGGAATFLVGALPFMLIYLPVARQLDYFNYNNVVPMIPHWWSLLCMGSGNYVWGWLPDVVMPDPWPDTWGELTMGVGVLTSIAWLGVTAFGVRLVSKKVGPPSEAAPGGVRSQVGNPVYLLFLGLLILATTLFYLIGMTYWRGFTPWKYVYEYFPGAGAIRAVSRYPIFLVLPMSVAFAFFLNYGIARVRAGATSGRRAGLAALLIFLGVFGVFEQFGVFVIGGTGFSKKVESTYLKAMAAKLPEGCTAFYVAARPGDRHNPFEYQYDAMLIAMMTGIPTFNGSSSKFPDRWELYQVKDPAYEDNVRKWVALNDIRGNVCRLELYPPVEAFDRSVPGPIDDPQFFVRQQYLDFLGREPEPAELEGWLNILEGCRRREPSCDHIYVSSAIFRSPEFLKRGWLVSSFYQVGLGRLPRYEEFVADVRRLGDIATPESEERSAAQFAEGFAAREDFQSLYGGLSAVEYVGRLAEAAGLKPEKKDELVRDPEGGGKTRGQVLKEVALGQPAFDRFYSGALVAMHYFGYLRRDPEPDGHLEWVKFVNSTGDMRTLTRGFLESDEYRQRFFIQN